MDPRIVSSVFVDPVTRFDSEARVYTRSGAFRYIPMEFRRTIHFRDDRIVVTLDLLAMNDLSLESLYENIPFVADGRVLQFYNHGEEGREIRGEDLDSGIALPPFRALTVGNGEGAGSTFIFDREHRPGVAAPYRYRSGAPHVSGLQLPLPHEWKAGGGHRLRYEIHSHESALEPGQVAILIRESSECSG